MSRHISWEEVLTNPRLRGALLTVVEGVGGRTLVSRGTIESAKSGSNGIEFKRTNVELSALSPNPIWERAEIDSSISVNPSFVSAPTATRDGRAIYFEIPFIGSATILFKE